MLKMVHSALNNLNSNKTNSHVVPTEDISKSIISNGLNNKLDLTASTLEQNGINNSNCIGIIHSNKKGMFYALNHDNRHNTEDDNNNNKVNNDKSILTSTTKTENESTVIGNNIKPYKIGDVYCFCYYNGYALITISTHFLFPLSLVLVLNIINICTVLFLSKFIHFLLSIISIFIFVIQSSCHWILLIINPGIPNRKWFLSVEIIKKLSDENSFKQHFNVARYQICKKCQLLIDKELSIIHCEYCNVCCEEYDHHCPWVGKCIGKYNCVLFNWFIYSTIVYLIYSIMLFVYVVIIK